jgi:hypothetical protein
MGQENFRIYIGPWAKAHNQIPTPSARICCKCGTLRFPKMHGGDPLSSMREAACLPWVATRSTGTARCPTCPPLLMVDANADDGHKRVTFFLASSTCIHALPRFFRRGFDWDEICLVQAITKEAKSQ